MLMVTIRLPEWMVKALDDLVERGLFASRSEVIRAAVREYLRVTREWNINVWDLVQNKGQITREEKEEEK